ncbi:MAG: hypothetical protein AB7Q29_11635 [Vicinamibacterales bacterium]
MGYSNQTLEQSHDLDWLVEARNRIQSLMLRLLHHWESLASWRRQAALAAAFSLWRAVFLLVRDPEQSLDRVDVAAKKFLERVVRTNAVTFADDLRTRSWSSVYYVENAMHRIAELTKHEFLAFQGSPSGTVRDGWNEAFEQLDRAIPGGTAPPLQGDGTNS